MSAYGTGGIVILMTDWNNSTEATGDGVLMCSDNPTVHTLHTPIGHSEGSAKSDSKPRACAQGRVWKKNMTGVDLKYDVATMAAYLIGPFYWFVLFSFFSTRFHFK